MPNYPSPSFSDYQFLDVLNSLIASPTPLSPHYMTSCKTISVWIIKIQVFF